MDQVTTSNRTAAGKVSGTAKSFAGSGMSGISDNLRHEKYQKMKQKHQVSSEGPSISTVQHQRLKSANDGGIMKPGQVRDKRHANYSMDRQAADNTARVPQYVHKAGSSEIPPNVGVSLGIPASTTGQDSAKNFKISFVGDQALLLQHQRKNSKHKASKSNANAVHKSPVGGSISKDPSSHGPSKQSFHNKIQFHAPTHSGKHQNFPLHSASGTGSNTAAQPSPIISTKRVPQKILDATITGSLSPNNERSGVGIAYRELSGGYGRQMSKSGVAGVPSAGVATPGIKSTTGNAFRDSDIVKEGKLRNFAGSSQMRTEVKHNNFMQIHGDLPDDRSEPMHHDNYDYGFDYDYNDDDDEGGQHNMIIDQSNMIAQQNQDGDARSLEHNANIDLDDTIEESVHIQFNLNQHQVQNNENYDSHRQRAAHQKQHAKKSQK